MSQMLCWRPKHQLFTFLSIRHATSVEPMLSGRSAAWRLEKQAPACTCTSMHIWTTVWLHIPQGWFPATRAACVQEMIEVHRGREDSKARAQATAKAASLVECQPNTGAPLLRDEKARRDWVERELDICCQVSPVQSASCNTLSRGVCVLIHVALSLCASPNFWISDLLQTAHMARKSFC